MIALPRVSMTWATKLFPPEEVPPPLKKLASLSSVLRSLPASLKCLMDVLRLYTLVSTVDYSLVVISLLIFPPLATTTSL